MDDRAIMSTAELRHNGINMAEEASGFSLQAKRLREMRDELERKQRTKYGEEKWALRQDGGRAGLLAEDARNRGFVYFSTILDLSSDGCPIRLRFCDGKGDFYERSLGHEKMSRQHKLHTLPNDWTDFKSAVYCHVMDMGGMKMRGRGMGRNRVRATAISVLETAPTPPASPV